jgi:hypothetical protein
VWHNLVAYLILYYTLSLVYRFALDDGGKVIPIQLKRSPKMNVT